MKYTIDIRVLDDKDTHSYPTLYPIYYDEKNNECILGLTVLPDTPIEEALEKINVKNDLVRVVVSAENENCPAFGDPNIETDPAYWIQWVLNLMKYMAIIALLVLVISDFFKAIVENDKDALKKAGNKALKRFIYCVLLFFLPTIISLIMTMFGAYGTCGIG